MSTNVRATNISEWILFASFADAGIATLSVIGRPTIGQRIIIFTADGSIRRIIG
jgi:hypothetical protein